MTEKPNPAAPRRGPRPGSTCQRRPPRSFAVAVQAGAKLAARASFVAAVIVSAPPVFAQSAGARDAGGSSASQAQYLLDRERCNDPTQYEDKAACLREAAAAREQRRGATGNGNGEAPRNGPAAAGDPQNAYQRNQARRCDPLPADQRADCLKRVQGEGFTAGSVGGGGIYRESVTREIGGQPPVTPVEVK